LLLYLVYSCSEWMVVCRVTKKANVELELLTGTDTEEQEIARMFTVMFSSSFAADEFSKLFKKVSQ